MLGSDWVCEDLDDGFTVEDKMLFCELVVDKEVEFEFMQQGSDFIVTTVK